MGKKKQDDVGEVEQPVKEDSVVPVEPTTLKAKDKSTQVQSDAEKVFGKMPDNPDDALRHIANIARLLDIYMRGVPAHPGNKRKLRGVKTTMSNLAASVLAAR